LQEKVDPYLRPLYDALYDLLEPERVDKMLEKNVIEVAPLAFMRGRTLNDAFIIMDEAQNTTIEQMKMFLTRLGNNSKAVITGDITQIDLPNPRKSGLVDAITSTEQRVNDGLPETLEEVVARYGHRWFKLKVSGDAGADVARLTAIASLLDRLPGYRVSLDGNEQYENVEQVLELWRRMEAAPRLQRLVASVAFIEQPIKRQNALAADVSVLSSARPVIIDESDDTLDAFVRAKARGYRGVSSKTCKGIYKSLINAGRCRRWGSEYFMTGEDLTVQAGIALQQDLALVSLLGLTHVERNGHHYVNGMAGLPAAEQDAFLQAHPDLYERSHGAVRMRITKGQLAIGSLGCSGYASAATPAWNRMREMNTR